MRLPTPTIPISTQQSGQFSAPGIAPVQDFTGQQLQQVGQSLQQAGASASRLGQEVQAELDQGFLMEADAIASEEVRNVLGSYQQRAGLDAIEAFEDTHKGLKDRFKNLSGTARSPQQRQALDRILAQRFQDASDRMATHRDRAVRDHAIGGTDASRKSAILDYHRAIGNPEDMALARELAMERTAEMSRMRGEDGDAAKLAMLGTTTQMHLGAVASLLEAGRSEEADAYLKQYRGEMDEVEYRRAQATAKAAVIEDTARTLTSTFYRFDDRMKWVDEKFQGSADEKESMRRHLMQQQELRDRADAQNAQEVRKEAVQWMRENPNLDPRQDFPELAERMDRYNVVVKRVPVTDDAWVQANLRDARKIAQLRELTPEQRENILAPHLSEAGLKKELAFIDGDQHAFSKAEMFDRAAVALGVPLSTADQGEAAKTAAAQARMRFDAMLNREIELRRSKKGADLSLTEIQKEIIDPMLMARNYVAKGDWSPERMPLAEAQVRGLMPTSIDDPATEVDESQSFEGAGDFYVETPTARVYLRDITLQQRREIALAWARRPENQGRQMTLKDEAEAWVEQYKPAVDAKKAATQSTKSAEQMETERLRASGRVFGPK